MADCSLGGAIRNGATMAFLPLKMAIAAAAAALATMASAAPQTGKIKSTHGAWSIVCDTPEPRPSSAR